jgi:pectate lyase
MANQSDPRPTRRANRGGYGRRRASHCLRPIVTGRVAHFGAGVRVWGGLVLAVVLAAGAGACQPAAFRGEPVAASQAGMPAFAGALGFGRHATGWRGGRVIKVTTLDDRGPGSLRACAEDDRPRVCIFEVAGTIEVDSTIAVGSNVYLAGQTAPGDGVQLRLGHSRQRPLMVHVASDVVIRHLRLRPGPPRTPSRNVDGIGIFDSHDVILDHLSVQYATDELLDLGTLHGSSYDITVQDSLLAWGLDRANHPKGKHSKGALICAMNSRGECGRITLVRNLFAHNRDRNPDVKGTPIGPVEIVNNVFYDPKSQFGEFYDLNGDLRVNYIGNTALSGPSTRRTNAPYAFDIDDFSLAYDVRVYVRDNLDPHRREASEPDELVAPPGVRAWLVSEPFQPLTVAPIAADAARDFVLANAGATRPARDALDQRAIEEVLNRSGRVIDDPVEAGGWPRLSSGPVPPDSDGDGMPDPWEVSHGTDPQAFDAWSDADGNGWANLEDYLNARAQGAGVATQ